MTEPTPLVEKGYTDACPNDCGDHCGNPAWSREDYEARIDRLLPLAEHLRLGFDVPEDQRTYRSTWLYTALLADEWFIDTEGVTDEDRRDVSAWLIREADQRVHLFPQRRDGVDALLRHLAERVLPPGRSGSDV